MRSLKAIVILELYNQLGDGSPTADPRIMEAVNSHLEGVKPLFDKVSVNVIQMTAQA